jgi:hypothetical protein
MSDDMSDFFGESHDTLTGKTFPPKPVDGFTEAGTDLGIQNIHLVTGEALCD